MKPLELTVFPRSEVLDAYKTADGSMVWYTFVVDEIRDSKRLNDAELAAEYWRGFSDESMISEGYNWHQICGEWSSSEEDAVHRAKVLTRFATLPHASERNYQ